VPDTGRLPDLATLTRGELQRTRRDLAAALALARPGSTACLPIGTHLAAIDAELATRVSQNSHLPAAAPGTGAGPDIEEVRGPLEHTMHLRMALDLLQERLTTAYTCHGLESELWALREKIDAAELTQLRALGYREYLINRSRDAGPAVGDGPQRDGG
jgi:hypothetical protein